MPEAETPPVTSENELVPRKSAGGSMLERWVEGDSEKAIERVNTMVRMLEQLRLASIKATYPSDWLIHTTTDPDGAIVKQVGYLQDSGAERAGKIWGIEVGMPAIEREDFPDGTYIYHLTAEAWSKVTGERIESVEGSRWSGDAFFQRQVKNEGDKVNPTDVRKAAYANLHGRAVRALAGLHGVPLEMLRQAGLETGKLVFLTYGRGTSGAAVGTADIVIGWGNAKGTKVSDLSERDLTFYRGAYDRDVADPAKGQYQKRNQRVLEALKAEQEKRERAAAQPTGGEDAPAGAEFAGGGRGQKLGELLVRLRDVLGKPNQRAFAAYLKRLTKEFGAEKAAISDLTDDELERLGAMSDDDLRAVAAEVVRELAK
jgi:hypothetical protein